MKNATYIAEITAQKMKSISLRGEILLLACLLASCQLRNFWHEFTEILKNVLPFLTNQATRFISHGIGHSYFMGIFFIIPFMV